jgi:hypothetical protein
MKFGPGGEPQQAQQLLAAADEIYLVMEGLPQRMAQAGGAKLQESLKKTSRC